MCIKIYADQNNTGFSDSPEFSLDTHANNSPGQIDLNQTSFADSGIFNLDTSNGTSSPIDSNNSNFADSGGFHLDTTNGSNIPNNLDFADSGMFALNTTDSQNSGIDPQNSGFANSDLFDLNTTDQGGNSQSPNNPPHFQSDGNFSVPENQAFVFDFNATDPDGDPLSYSIANGDDAHKFELIPSTGLLAFTYLPDFESPEDNNSDNIYELTVQVTDGNDSALLNVVVQVNDLFESSPNNPPYFQSDGNFSVPENQAFVFDFNATDPDGDPLRLQMGMMLINSNSFHLLGFLLLPIYLISSLQRIIILTTYTN